LVLASEVGFKITLFSILSYQFKAEKPTEHHAAGFNRKMIISRAEIKKWLCK